MNSYTQLKNWELGKTVTQTFSRPIWSIVMFCQSPCPPDIDVRYRKLVGLSDDVSCVQMSHPMGKPTICIGENKGADQLRGTRDADQRLCFRYTDSTIPLLLKSEISSFQAAFVTVQPSMCRAWLETTLLVFPQG